MWKVRMSERIIGSQNEENDAEDSLLSSSLNDLRRQITRVTELTELEIPEKINGLNLRLEENHAEYTGITERLSLAMRGTEYLRGSLAETNDRIDEVDTRLIRTRADLGNFESVKPEEVQDLIKRIDYLQSDNSVITQSLNGLSTSLNTVRDSIIPLGDKLREFESEFIRLENRVQLVESIESSVTQVFSNELTTRLGPIEGQLRTLLDNFTQVRREVSGVIGEHVEVKRSLDAVTLRTAKIELFETRVNDIGNMLDAVIRQIADLVEEDKRLASHQIGIKDRIEDVNHEIISLIDQVSDEFKRFNTQQEGQRRRQIQTMSQDLRESTFHNLNPPTES